MFWTFQVSAFQHKLMRNHVRRLLDSTRSKSKKFASSSSSPLPPPLWLTTALGLIGLTASQASDPFHASTAFIRPSMSLTYCEGDKDSVKDDAITLPPFPDSVLSYDHYKGVILDLEELDVSSENFRQDLENALIFWRAEGRKGIWIHVPASKADWIPDCVALGFTFHFVKEHVLVLSQWLTEGPSRLPLGPTHQIGVGAFVLKPNDPTKMLVVQEKTGPAAAYRLWKMPTGLLDPGEDIPDAALRELQEETGLKATMDGIVCFRQAHSSNRSSDLFFVCRMNLDPPNQKWTVQEDEIADIQWMSVEAYCAQDRWQGSGVYEAMNDTIRKVSALAYQRQQQEQHSHDDTMAAADTKKISDGLIIHEKLPLGFTNTTNAFFRSQL